MRILASMPGLLWALALAWAAAPAARAESESSPGASVDDLLAAVVKLEAHIPPTARSAGILGTARAGSGVLIGEDGLILTIGYLILEASEVRVTVQDGTRLPAAVVGYDPNTGFGLVRALRPIAAKPTQLGHSSALKREDPVLIVLGSGEERVQSAIIVSRRVFAGYWEYLLERALFTSPPVEQFAGAALFDKELRLVGIGSLFVRDAAEGMELPGNMFVPIDEARAILPDLVRSGRSSAPARPWLGVLLAELYEHVFITRINPEGPAERAGLNVGDIVIEVAGKPVSSLEALYRELWKLGNAGIMVPLKVLQRNKLVDVQVRSIDRQSYYRGAAR
jgi:S1-C subfamily serine protease